MKEVKRFLVAVLMAVMIAAVGMAQKGGDRGRPPKDNSKVVDKPKDRDNPPPRNSNNSGNNSNTNRRGKP